MTSSGKVRIYELSKDLGLENKDVLDAAEKLSIAAKSHSSSISDDEAAQIRNLIKSGRNGATAPAAPAVAPPAPPKAILAVQKAPSAPPTSGGAPSAPRPPAAPSRPTAVAKPAGQPKPPAAAPAAPATPTRPTAAKPAAKPAAKVEAPQAADVPAAPKKPRALKAPRKGGADDLKLIKGVGPKLEELLHSLGFFHFDQIAAWTEAELAWVDDNLEGFKGRATRDEWVAQAKHFAAGGTTEHAERVKKGDA